MSLDGGERRSFLNSEGQPEQRSAEVSRDGRWVAYVSKELGMDRVYVQPFPEGGKPVLVSGEDEAAEPVWGNYSTELFYRNSAYLYAVELDTDPELRVVGRKALFPNAGHFRYLDTAAPVYDYDRRTDRFLMPKRVNDFDNKASIQVVVNFFEVLKKLAPPK